MRKVAKLKASRHAEELDAIRRRLVWLPTHTDLAKVAITESGWETLYRDPRDLRLWELTYPQSEMHRGGPPMLRCLCLSLEEAKAKYGF